MNWLTINYPIFENKNKINHILFIILLCKRSHPQWVVNYFFVNRIQRWGWNYLPEYSDNCSAIGRQCLFMASENIVRSADLARVPVIVICIVNSYHFLTSDLYVMFFRRCKCPRRIPAPGVAIPPDTQSKDKHTQLQLIYRADAGRMTCIWLI